MKALSTIDLLAKYDVPTPRYTSYPPLPKWQDIPPSSSQWFDSLNKRLKKDANVSLYIHLPFCEALCTYCACNKRITKNHQVESPYIDAIISEWQLYIDQLEVVPVIEEIHLGGGTPSFFSPAALDRMLTAIKHHATIDSDPHFAFEAHPNNTRKEHLEVLFQHGFRRMSVGVQDISEHVLTAINRHQTTDQIASLCASARSIGYESINFDMIYGLPFQGLAEIEASMNFVDELRPDRIAFYSYAHVPWKSKGQRAFTEHDISFGAEKLALKNFGDELLTAYGYQPIGMDHYALPTDSLFLSQLSHELHRNFMGFTERKTNCLIGLGCSSISDSGDMYIQNEKGVEDYQASVRLGHLPIIKGHHITALQKQIAEHIIELTCYGETTWGDHKEAILIPALIKLIELENDGLIILSDWGITISERGLPFIRNICAALDPFYQLISGINQYSKAV